MNVAMVIPERESEKAISSYAMEITKNIKKQKVNIDNVFYKAGSPLSLLKSIPKLRKYDIIHLHHEYNLLGWYGTPFFLVYFLLSFLKKNALVTMMHTVLSQNEKFLGNALKNFLRKKLYFFQNRVIDWVSDSVIVSMQFHKDILTKEYMINSDKIKVFPSGGPTNFKIIPKSKAKKELNLSGPVYLIIGNLVPDHGAEIIIKQADKIGKTILVVSSPHSVNDRNQKRLTNYIKHLKKIVNENKFEKYVRFDILPINDQMPIWWKYFSAADLVLQAYRKGIGSGIFLHAMATKTPVVANNTEFFNEISGRFGCLRIAENEEDYPKAIKESMKPKNYTKMKKECERYLKENGWAVISRKYKDLYNQIIKLP